MPIDVSQLPDQPSRLDLSQLPDQPAPTATPEGRGVTLDIGNAYEAAKAGPPPPPAQIPDELKRPLISVADYIKGMIPTSGEELERVAGVPTDWTDPSQLAGFAMPWMRPEIDLARQAQSRYQQIQDADETPPWSQERWNAGIGTAADLAGLGAMLHGAIASGEGIPSRAQPSVADAIQALNAQPAPDVVQPQASVPVAQPEIITPSLGDPFHPPEVPQQDLPYAGGPQTPVPPAAEAPAGTSNRQNVVTYGEGAVPSGVGADTTQLLDNARADIRSGAVDPYSVLSKTRQSGIANPQEYAALAAEHERLVNDAVAKQKANDPSAPEAVQRATDFANAIQPHKTAASDLFRLMQGDLNYDLSTPYGMNEYMKSELGRGITPSEAPKFNRMSQDIRNGEGDVAQAVARSDARVRNAYAKVADIPMDQAVARVKQMLKDCL